MINREGVIALIKKEADKLGSLNKVATRADVSLSVLSYILKGTYKGDEQVQLNKIATALGYETDESWKIAMTDPLLLLQARMSDAKKKSTFLAISEKAGAGKSATITHYADSTKEVFVLRAREWSAKMFLTKLMQLLGIAEPKGMITSDERISLICGFFAGRRAKKPQLIIDEADKLRPAALRTLIPIYNECEDVLSVVIAGTENLYKEIKNGVKYARKGFDEIDSRFGRFYHTMEGCTQADVAKICVANGLTDKALQKRVWDEMDKQAQEREGRSVKVVRDMRLLKHAVQREFLVA